MNGLFMRFVGCIGLWKYTRILTFRELGSFTSFLEAVFTAFFFTRVACEETSFFESLTEIAVDFQKGTADAVTDCAGLAGRAATLNVSDDVVLFSYACEYERLFNNQFQCFTTEIFVQFFFVDCDFTLTRNQTNSSNGCLSTASAVVLCYCHEIFLPVLISECLTSKLQVSEPDADVQHLHKRSVYDTSVHPIYFSGAYRELPFQQRVPDVLRACGRPE